MPTKTYQEVMAALKPQELPQELPEEIPDERGEFREPPQPGSYRWRCPAAIENCFDLIDVAQKDAEGNVVMVDDPAKPGEKTPLTYQRVNLIFDGPNALVIAQSPGGKTDGEPFSTRISNIERPRFVSKNVSLKVSDLTYLLRAKAPDQRPRINAQFIALALQVLPSQEFGADVEWQGFCNPKNDAYFAFTNEKGETVYETAKRQATDTENAKGCGERIYSNKWPRTPEGYAPRAQCKCGAWIRPFAQLARFKA